MIINRKQIWSLSWPVIIANLTIPLVGLTDTAIMGHMPSSEYIASIAIGALIFTFLYAGLNFLRMGTTGIIAQNLGKKNSEEILLSFLRPIILCFILSFLIVISKEYILDFSIYILNPDHSLRQHMQEYFHLRILAIPFGLVNLVFLGWFFGLQKPKSVLLQIIIINFFNISFSIYFALILNKGIQGIALGSVLAQISGFIVSMIIFFQHFKNFNLSFLVLKKLNKVRPFLELFNISRDLFLRTICLIIVKIYIFTKAVMLGVNELATLEILIIIFSISSSILDAFAHTAESTVGNSIGSKNLQELKKCIKYSSEVAFIFSLLIGLCLFIFERQIFILITDIEDLLELLKSLWIYVIFTPIISVLAFQLDGIFIGATLAKYMRNSMILSAAIFYTLIEFVLDERLNLESLYICFLFFLLSRGILLSFSMKSVFELAKVRSK